MVMFYFLFESNSCLLDGLLWVVSHFLWVGYRPNYDFETLIHGQFLMIVQYEVILEHTAKTSSYVSEALPSVSVVDFYLISGV